MNKYNLEEGDVVLCTVEKIDGTIVFVKIDGNGQGSIITSEIAPGRIRNLRAYVVPKKKIVCKVLRITDRGNIHLSLRRVTLKEKKEVLEQNKQEKRSSSILKSVLGEKTKDIIKKIKEDSSVSEFLEDSKQDSKDLEKLVGKKDTEKILEIINIEKSKKAVIKKDFQFKTAQPNGLELIKKILNLKGRLSEGNRLGVLADAEIKYVSAGKYSIKVEADDMKKADHKLQEVLKEIEIQAKKNKVEFSLKKR
jgi:translation initiation factor 2 alpha subunit (eIF-2alpha)